MASKRIYTVGTPDGQVRLVRAVSRSQALSHVANSLFTIRVASQEDLVTTISFGTPVESARDGDQLTFEE